MSTEQFDSRAEPTMDQAAEDPSVRHPAQVDDPTSRRGLDDRHADDAGLGRVGERTDPPGDEHGAESTDRDSADIADEVTPD